MRSLKGDFSRFLVPEGGLSRYPKGHASLEEKGNGESHTANWAGLDLAVSELSSTYDLVMPSAV